MITLQPINKDRLARLAIALLEHSTGRHIKLGDRKLEFDMRDYISSGINHDIQPAAHACGTTCCFLGFAPMIDEEAAACDDWDDVFEYVIGSGNLDSVYYFLLDVHLPDSPKRAAARALYVLEDKLGTSEEDYEFSFAEDFDTSMTKAELITELRKYVKG